MSTVLYAGDTPYATMLDPGEPSMTRTNCKNCGAPARYGHVNCEYCGSSLIFHQEVSDRVPMETHYRGEIKMDASSITLSCTPINAFMDEELIKRHLYLESVGREA